MLLQLVAVPQAARQASRRVQQGHHDTSIARELLVASTANGSGLEGAMQLRGCCQQERQEGAALMALQLRWRAGLAVQQHGVQQQQEVLGLQCWPHLRQPAAEVKGWGIICAHIVVSARWASVHGLVCTEVWLTEL
jgi:hypothetical protein